MHNNKMSKLIIEFIFTKDLQGELQGEYNE